MSDDVLVPPRSEPRKPKRRYALQKWMQALAIEEWQAPQRLTQAERLALANELANAQPPTRGRGAKTRVPVVITLKMLRAVRERDDFKDLQRALEAGGLELARVKLYALADEAIDVHAWAMRRSVEKDDTRGVARLTSPFVESLLPRRVEHAHAVAAVVRIELPGHFARSLDAPTPTVEAVEAEIVAEPLDDEPDEPDAPALLGPGFPRY